jgi:broad specificity polyphosphatase/5'/3'-nucleotidase SurE
LDFVLKNKLLEKHSLYNINIPSNPKEILITRLGGSYYSDSFRDLGDGRVVACGKCVFEDSGNLELDTDATMSGYISITPMTIDLTDMDVFKRIYTQ